MSGTGLRILFMGTPEFAAVSLSALLTGPDRVIGVFTQPDRPTGRGLTMAHSPVKKLALHHEIPIWQPQRLKDPQVVAECQALQPDVIVVAAYGQIVPRAILDLPGLGCINVHASLLPRWRGAAPIQRAILAGDTHTGITIMQMDPGLDTGPMLAMESIPIGSTMTGGELHDALATLGADLLMRTLVGVQAGSVRPAPQPEEGVTLAPKLTRADEAILFERPALEIQRQILALNPWPGATTWLDGQPLKILRGVARSGSGQPGTTLALHADGVEIACGSGSILVTELQPAGKRRMTATDWLRGRAINPGRQWGRADQSFPKQT
ncbi:MAG: methionyl-tRNA formyltransferase [Magnetococcales bacterium]|nr:methionyl-tRNA formyltransferase [Magnetococcales bacterium]NGZ07061.1 methionyl-tRNA formyltransferase [Magnetococcales bacterium]